MVQWVKGQQIGFAAACEELAVHVLERFEAWGRRETDQGMQGKRPRKLDLGGPHVGACCVDWAFDSWAWAR